MEIIFVSASVVTLKMNKEEINSLKEVSQALGYAKVHKDTVTQPEIFKELHTSKSAAHILINMIMHQPIDKSKILY